MKKDKKLVRSKNKVPKYNPLHAGKGPCTLHISCDLYTLLRATDPDPDPDPIQLEMMIPYRFVLID